MTSTTDVLQHSRIALHTRARGSPPDGRYAI
jgi:hypothetical protein